MAVTEITEEAVVHKRQRKEKEVNALLQVCKCRNETLCFSILSISGSCPPYSLTYFHVSFFILGLLMIAGFFVVPFSPLLHHLFHSSSPPFALSFSVPAVSSPFADSASHTHFLQETAFSFFPLSHSHVL